MGTTRFSGTVLRSGKGSEGRFFTDLPISANPDFITFWDDFTAVALDATNAWTVVKDSGAAVAIAADTAGGECLITSTATTDNDGGSIQGNEIFLPAAGRRIAFEARVKLSAPSAQEIFVGLSENFATNPEAVLAASNRIGFQTTDSSGVILCKTEASDTETSTTTSFTATAATYVTLGFAVMGSQVEFYINRQRVAVHTTNVPAAELAPAVLSLSGSASGTRTMHVDYVGVWANR